MSVESPPVGSPSADGPSAGPPSEQLLCSAKGCRTRASTGLRWRNPRLHDAARVKQWLACDEHTEHLADFLARRGFLLAREPLAPPFRR